MYVIPKTLDDTLLNFAKKIGCSWIGAVLVDAKSMCSELQCHTNVLTYCQTYGYERRIGYYFIKNLNNGKLEAILHSVVATNKMLIDITPFSDGREYNIVGLLGKQEVNYNFPYIVQ